MQVYRYYRDLVSFQSQGNPVTMLKCINPLEASLLDAAAGVHLKFRLAGVWLSMCGHVCVCVCLFVCVVCASMCMDLCVSVCVCVCIHVYGSVCVCMYSVCIHDTWNTHIYNRYTRNTYTHMCKGRPSSRSAKARRSAVLFLILVNLKINLISCEHNIIENVNPEWCHSHYQLIKYQPTKLGPYAPSNDQK